MAAVKQANERNRVALFIHSKFDKKRIRSNKVGGQIRIVKGWEALRKEGICDYPRQRSIKQVVFGSRRNFFQLGDTAKKSRSEFGISHVGA